MFFFCRVWWDSQQATKGLSHQPSLTATLFFSWQRKNKLPFHLNLCKNGLKACTSRHTACHWWKRRWGDERAANVQVFSPRPAAGKRQNQTSLSTIVESYNVLSIYLSIYLCIHIHPSIHLTSIFNWEDIQSVWRRHCLCPWLKWYSALYPSNTPPWQAFKCSCVKLAGLSFTLCGSCEAL